MSDIYFKNQDELKEYLLSDCLIYKSFSGSKFYGTDTESSDTDYIGIYTMPAQILFGLYNVDEIEQRTAGKNNRNMPEDIDTKYYSIRKFFDIAYKNGPNCIELFFTNRKTLLHTTPIWERIRESYPLFVSQRVFKSMFGYAFTQRNLARNKRDRYLNIEKGVGYLEQLLNEGIQKLSEEHITKLKEVSANYVNKSGRAREYMVNQPVLQVYDNMVEELNGYGHRAKAAMAQAEMDYKYDWKFFSHSIRLLVQCIELASTGKIEYPLEHRDLLVDIKTGKYKIHEVEEMFDQYDDMFNRAKEHTVLPVDPDYHGINKLLIEICQEGISK